MVFVLYIGAAWFVLSCFSALSNKINKLDNLFLYMTIILLDCNGTWIFIEEMKTIVLTTPRINYFAFLVFRTIVIPCSIMYCQNVLLSAASLKQKFGAAIMTYSFLALMERLATLFYVYTYIKWTLMYSILFYILLQILSHFFLKWFQRSTAEKE
jgi:hypothetical protein